MVDLTVRTKALKSKLATSLFKEDCEQEILFCPTTGRYCIGFTLSNRIKIRESMFDWKTFDEANKILNSGTFVPDPGFLSVVEGQRRPNWKQSILAQV